MAGKACAEALAVLEQYASSPRAHAAIKTLRAELDVSGGKSEDKPPMSPGMKAASNAPGSSFGNNAGKAAAFARMKGGKK